MYLRISSSLLQMVSFSLASGIKSIIKKINDTTTKTIVHTSGIPGINAIPTIDAAVHIAIIILLTIAASFFRNDNMSIAIAQKPFKDSHTV